MFPNWFKDVEKYFRHVPSVPLRALQIGTYTGDATEWLLKNRTIEYLDDVDTWEGSEEAIHKSFDWFDLESFYDKNETMRDYGYMIYRDYHIQENKRYFDYNAYMDKFFSELYKEQRIQRKWVKHVIFISAVIIIIFFLYKNK